MPKGGPRFGCHDNPTSWKLSPNQHPKNSDVEIKNINIIYCLPLSETEDESLSFLERSGKNETASFTKNVIT